MKQNCLLARLNEVMIAPAALIFVYICLKLIETKTPLSEEKKQHL